ncbi:hypothetical protein ACHRVW_06085 [Flavobacterium collinsii]|uniref:hypothetical protein n=1 Tax=Flavobacterium collinsii TaxID=1114861 RepID=UPI0037581213
MEKVLLIVPLFFGLGYLFFYMLTGANSNPKTFRYNQLFEADKLIKHLIFALIFSIIGLVRYNSSQLEAFYFLPILFILALKSSNPLFRLLYNRNIIIALRWDNPPKGRNGIKILDRIIGVAIVAFSCTGPILLKLLIKII